MRSARINRHEGPPEDDTSASPTPRVGRRPPDSGIRRFQRWPRVGAVLVVVLVLTGCASGTANEAERAQRRAASEPAILAERQATANAAPFAASTPSAAPTSTPTIRVWALGLALELGADNAPRQMIGTVPSNAGSVYAVIEVEGVPPGTTLTATWLVNAPRPEDRTVLATVEQTISHPGRQWVAFSFSLDGTLSPGAYALVVESQDEALGTLGIEVTNPGTAPRPA